MPFRSEAQRKFLFMKHPKVAREFAEHTPKGAKLPEHVSAKFGGADPSCVSQGGRYHPPTKKKRKLKRDLRDVNGKAAGADYAAGFHPPRLDDEKQRAVFKKVREKEEENLEGRATRRLSDKQLTQMGQEMLDVNRSSHRTTRRELREAAQRAVVMVAKQIGGMALPNRSLDRKRQEERSTEQRGDDPRRRKLDVKPEHFREAKTERGRTISPDKPKVRKPPEGAEPSISARPARTSPPPMSAKGSTIGPGPGGAGILGKRKATTLRELRMHGKAMPHMAPQENSGRSYGPGPGWNSNPVPDFGSIFPGRDPKGQRKEDAKSKANRDRGSMAQARNAGIFGFHGTPPKPMLRAQSKEQFFITAPRESDSRPRLYARVGFKR